MNLNIRMDSSANYADVVLPAAFWYENYDDFQIGEACDIVRPAVW